MIKIRFVLLITAFMFLNNCGLTTGIGALGLLSSTTNDRRSAGTIIDDETLSFFLNNWIDKNPIAQDGHISFLVYDHVVLLTGEVPNENAKVGIEQAMLIKRSDIILARNELIVAPNSKIIDRLKDLQIRLLIKALFYNQDVFYPGHILIQVEQGVVYLMGSATKQEAVKAVKQTAKVKGVKKIITLFNYLKQRPQSEIELANKKQKEAEYQAEFDRKRSELEREKLNIQKKIKVLQEQQSKRDSDI